MWIAIIPPSVAEQSGQAMLWQAAANGLGRSAMSATLVSNLGWYPASWRRFPASQMPSYSDPSQLSSIEARLQAAAPVMLVRPDVAAG